MIVQVVIGDSHICLVFTTHIEVLEICGSRAGHLRIRLKTYSGGKSNKCNQCDFACSDPRSLSRHLKTHSEVKSNKCNQCDFASFYISALRKHLKIHSGEKPNKCNQCDFAPSQAGHLRAHLKTHSLLKCNSFIVHRNFLIHPFLVKSYHLLPKVAKN